MNNDPYSTEWSQEDLAALPHTTQVFEHKPLDFNAHDWIQEGYSMRDACKHTSADCHRGSLPLAQGQMLVKNKKGEYKIVDEQTRQ